jgi:hypothetical protein
MVYCQFGVGGIGSFLFVLSNASIFGGCKTQESRCNGSARGILNNVLFCQYDARLNL